MRWLDRRKAVLCRLAQVRERTADAARGRVRRAGVTAVTIRNRYKELTERLGIRIEP